VERQTVFQKIRVVRNLNSQVPILLLDANQIQQVFMNILLNAADAMAAQGTLTITSSHVPGDPFVQVKFTDTGCGIPEENLNKIFDPFFTTKAEKKETGLGLAVSYGIIDRHRGRIEVQSEVGKGTTVSIHLPLEAAEDMPAV
jgi:two-component system NtrC family sensor kinase